MGKKKSKAKDVLVLNILDRSGSMSGVADATIEGYNSMLADQREGEGKCLISEVQFDEVIDVTRVAVPIEEAEDHTHATYRPRSITALFDAVVVGIRGVEKWVHDHDFAGEVLVFIWTDGGENASTMYRDIGYVNRLIEEKQGEGWNFQFMGAGTAGWSQGHAFSAIPMSNRAGYDSTPTNSVMAFNAVSSSLRSVRGGASYGGVDMGEEAYAQ
jgi:hypothetical protein